MAAEVTGTDRTLPLPGWLVKVYYIFPVVLYIPDVIFNYYVYSDGVTSPGGTLVQQVAQVGLWGFLSIGVVGMAYLLSVLAPWHWGKGNHIRAVFCGVGVVVATGITVWNSLAYRSEGFKPFKTDEFAYQLFPSLGQAAVPLTMIFAAVAPPFWGLFWALVQPTDTSRSLSALRESHEERLLRLQQEAELKRLRAETNARVREAQLRGMAATAAAAREQAAVLLNRKTESGELPAVTAADAAAERESDGVATGTDGESKVVPMFTPAHPRDHGRSAVMSNHAAAVVPALHTAPASSSRASLSQPALLANADVANASGVPVADSIGFGQRRPPTPFGAPEPAAAIGRASDTPPMTGTTGPRPAVRPGQTGSLLSAMNGPNPAHVKVVTDAMRELGIPAGKKSLTPTQARALVPRIAEELQIDTTQAKALIGKVMQFQSQGATRA